MKKMHLISYFTMLLVSLLVVSQAFCQSTGLFIFEGRIKNLNEEKLILNRLRGHEEFKISEMQTNSDGSFILRLDEMPNIGQYRLRIDPGGRNNILDFLFTDENHIRFVTHADFLIDSIRFEKSEINQAWYNYFRLQQEYEARLSILEHLMNIYPEDDRFYPEIIKELNVLQDELAQKVAQLVSNHKNMLMERYILSDQAPRLITQLSADERQEFARNNYLNNVDFSDTLLLYTDIYPNKALSFIMLFRNPQLDNEQQAQEFIRATDKILPLAMMQPSVYNYLLSFTIGGFEQIGMSQVLTHIAENYPFEEICIFDQESAKLQRRMEGYRLLAPGRQAPNISTLDINNNVFELSEVRSDHLLIVFWASWCPHCTNMLPDIKTLALQINGNAGQNESPPLKVLSVSIDHAEADFLEYLEETGLNDPSIRNFWVNICDYEVWEGEIAIDYYLYATPTMILLNKDHKIIGKPSNVQELIKQLGILSRH